MRAVNAFLFRAGSSKVEVTTPLRGYSNVTVAQHLDIKPASIRTAT